MNGLLRLPTLGLAVALSFSSFILAATAPASAYPNCSSNANLWHVHRRLEGAISQLEGDSRDYGGHRQSAINNLNYARAQLVSAEQYAVSNEGQNPACFQAHGPTGGDANPYLRGQYGSNHNIWSVRRWLENLYSQLQGDPDDYGGHKGQAMGNIQAARNDLLSAEQYASSHGN